ncbi:MAG TPA: ATP-dependent DNA helicase RecG [Candidatus Edwardsbacteria bacterium]|nr:ATP-dependent DNA helicase RecG [Candidatus Edwardsbacteria bacterium]
MLEAVDIQYLKGVGPKRAELFRGIGVNDLLDLLYRPPRRYVDRSLIKPIKGIRSGETVTVYGEVADKGLVRTRHRLTIVNLLVSDGTGYLLCKWFNQPYLNDRFTVGQKLVVSGQVRFDRGLSLLNPEYELIDDEDAELIHTGRIVPLHPVTAGLSTRQYRVILRHALETYLPALAEPLPEAVAARHRLMPLAEAFRQVHFPETLELAAQARHRLAFEELFYLQTMIALQRRGFEAAASAHPLADTAWRPAFERHLDFTLTSAQRRVMAEISADLNRAKPMHRLLQGDVGSGKTVVALAAMLQAVGSGCQAALMAPTEILAEQHHASLAPWFQRLGIRAALLTSALGAKQRNAVRDGLASGAVQVAIGTHALIQDQVLFHRLGLAVVDEQHRFGVEQRAALRAKTGAVWPHQLVMTATPIPRTLAMTLYGDLDVSVIDELPAGRVPIVTRWTTEANRDKVYGFIAGQLAAGRQAYVVYPLIEESEKVDLKAAIKMHQHLARDVFPSMSVGLIHGRLPNDEREAMMRDFKAGKIHLLVATTVIEVGIDVPNATVMVVEQAERYGLSQLHQLRGRVGRSMYKSYCILLAGKKMSDEAKARLDIMQKSTDGFKIAEKDLEIRGPGEFWSTRQHGLPLLRIADLITDAQLVPLARKEAWDLVEKDPNLTTAEGSRVKSSLYKFYPQAGKYITTG